MQDKASMDLKILIAFFPPYGFINTLEKRQISKEG